MQIEEEALVDQRRVGRHEDVAGAAELDEHLTFIDDAGRKSGSDVIGHSCHHRYADFEAGHGGRRRGHHARNVERLSDWRQQRRRNAGRAQHVICPGSVSRSYRPLSTAQLISTPATPVRRETMKS